MPPRPAGRRPPTGTRSTSPPPALQRLQKVLAATGISSRRECEELILQERVEVDRRVVTELGTRVDPSVQEIRVDGVVLSLPRFVYYALNKPTGVVSTSRDPAGRPRVIDLVPPEPRVFPVGRLDRGSEGLMLLTNDGELTNRLTHPSYGIEKRYAVRVAGQVTVETLRSMRKGLYLADGFVQVRSVRISKRYKQSTDLEVVLDEGRNREIRRILARVGHKVLRLTRTSIGPLRLGELPSGAYRPLTAKEVRGLQRRAAGLAQEQAGAGVRGRRRAGGGQVGSGSRRGSQAAGRPRETQDDAPPRRPRKPRPPQGSPSAGHDKDNTETRRGGRGKKLAGELSGASGRGKKVGGRHSGASGRGKKLGGGHSGASGRGKKVGGEQSGASGRGKKLGGEHTGASGRGKKVGGGHSGASGRGKKVGGGHSGASGRGSKKASVSSPRRRKKGR